MKFRHIRRIIIFVCCCLAATAAYFMFDERQLEAFEEVHAHQKEVLGNCLLQRHGLIFFADMDDPRPVDLVTRTPLHIRECAWTQGRHDGARRIDLDRDTFLRADIRNPIPGPSATFAAWFRPRDLSRKQVLLSSKTPVSGFSVFLEGGDLSLTLGSTSSWTCVSCPYAGTTNRMTHVALAFSVEGVTLYQDGKATVSVKLDTPVVHPGKPLMYGRPTYWPFEGDIDEIAIWKRALDAGEIATIVHADTGLARLYEPQCVARCMTAGRKARILASVFRVFDRLAACGRKNASLAKEIPIFIAWPSSSDEHHFRAAHAASFRDGARTKKAANFRKINVAYADKMIPMEMALDEVYGAGKPSRMAFLVRDPSRELFGGSGLVRVYPPELHALIHPDAPYPLPLSAPFIRLYFGNVFRGLYVMEPFDRVGSMWMAYGSHDKSARKGIGYRSPPSAYDAPPDGILAAEAFKTTASLVSTDVFFPWSRQEMAVRVRERARIWTEQGFAKQDKRTAFIAKHILGDNPSLMYVTEDLKLDTLPGLHWESSAPEIISPSGKVTRPDDASPRSVTLTPVDEHRGRQDSRAIRVRVMPQHPSLQTLFLHIGAPVDRYSRSDFSCLRIPPGGGEGEWLIGTAASGGGLHHRGNTSYLRGVKRPLALKFDAPVSIIDGALPSRHLFFLSGYKDPTRIRNRLSFDAYRTIIGSRIPNGGTRIDWTEVFINGEYFGVWELTNRVRDAFTKDDGLLYKIRVYTPQLWASTSVDMSEVITPPDWRAETARPLEDLFARTVGAGWEAFPDTVSELFDIDSIVDFFLILNFADNHDGRLVNHYLARAAGGRWFILPWDYDQTFLGKNFILKNEFIQHCLDEVPGFRDSAVAKWKSLRSGELANDIVLTQVDAYAARLAPYMEEEYRLLKPADWDGDYLGSVNQLKKNVRRRLNVLDAYFR